MVRSTVEQFVRLSVFLSNFHLKYILTVASIFVTRVTKGSISPITAEMSMIALNLFKGPPLKFPDETFGTIKIFRG